MQPKKTILTPYMCVIKLIDHKGVDEFIEYNITDNEFTKTNDENR